MAVAFGNEGAPWIRKPPLRLCAQRWSLEDLQADDIALSSVLWLVTTKLAKIDIVLRP